MRNAYLVRPHVIISELMGITPFQLEGVSRVSGLSMGEEELYEINESSGVVKIPTGRITYSPVTLTLRNTNQASNEAFASLLQGNNTTFTMEVVVTNRGNKPLYKFKYHGCSILPLSVPDLGISENAVGEITVLILPYVSQFFLASAELIPWDHLCEQEAFDWWLRHDVFYMAEGRKVF